jgi:hypothetical protein
MTIRIYLEMSENKVRSIFFSSKKLLFPTFMFYTMGRDLTRTLNFFISKWMFSVVFLRLKKASDTLASDW